MANLERIDEELSKTEVLIEGLEKKMGLKRPAQSPAALAAKKIFGDGAWSIIESLYTKEELS